MLHCENLISTLDRFNATVFLKDVHGRYLSMNTAGIQLMSPGHNQVLGKTSHDLFDFASATRMLQSDHYAASLKHTHTTTFDAIDRNTGRTLRLFNAKTSVLAPSGTALGIVGISLVNCDDADLFSEASRLLPQFVQRKQPHLLNELLELQTVGEFFNVYRLH